MSEPTYDECLLAAEKVLGALEQVGETACLVGGMAIRLNGKKGRRVKVSWFLYVFTDMNAFLDIGPGYYSVESEYMSALSTEATCRRISLVVLFSRAENKGSRLQKALFPHARNPVFHQDRPVGLLGGQGRNTFLPRLEVH
jgi:hypothetical protein